MTHPDFVLVRLEHAETLLESVRAYYRFDGIGFELDSVRRAIRQLLEIPSLGEAWLIRDGDEVIGHFVVSFGFDIEFGGRQATLTELYLVEHARGRGVGSAALDFLQERLNRGGIRALELQAEKDNIQARRFYERAGFVAETRVPFTKRW
jgi:diamine N-acetyltransferase